MSIDMPAGPSEQLCVCLKVSEKLIPAEALLSRVGHTKSLKAQETDQTNPVESRINVFQPVERTQSLRYF